MSPATDTFLTIERSCEGIFKEKGSRFLAFAFPVSSENEVKQIVRFIQQKYFDARHHCYAYRLGTDQPLHRVYDDGEPSNSAGKPILGQIIAFDLTNIIVVVVRYFGGILLGVGGLIQAYKMAAREALKAATIVTGVVTKHFHIEADYAAMNLIVKMANDFHAEVYEQKFHETCEANFQIRESQALEFIEKLKRIESVHIQSILPTSNTST